MSFNFYEIPRGAIKAMFLRSEYSSPDEMRSDLVNFEKSSKTLRVSLRGPMEKNLWMLTFFDLEREIEPGTGRFEEYFFNILTLSNGRLWELYSDQSKEVFRKTVGRLVDFTSKLEYAFIPPTFMHELMESYGKSQEMVAFSAKRDYFTLTVSNPGFISKTDFADLKYKSANVPNDYRILVAKERPVGPLMLSSIDLRIKSEDKECKIRMSIDGFLSQVGLGDREIYLEIRKILLQFFGKQEEWLKYIPRSEPEVIEDKEKSVIIQSRKLLPSYPFTIRLSSVLEPTKLDKLTGLFTSNIETSQFIGSIEKEIPKESYMITTTDLRGGGEAIIIIEKGKSEITIYPRKTASIRILERIYRVILEKFDVDAIFKSPPSKF